MSAEPSIRDSPPPEPATKDAPGQPVGGRERWLARLAILLAVAAVLSVLAVAGVKSIGLVLVGLGGVVCCAAAVWWFLSTRGISRAVSGIVVALAPAAVLVTYIWAGLLWIVLVSIALWAVAGVTGGAALVGAASSTAMVEHAAGPLSHPFVIMNPKSGGGKVVRFDLADKARALGAEVFVLDTTQQVDIADVAREAVRRGADLLGVAGGDGTQALVADVAAACDVPLLVISAGTRNHFALDLGLDREDPARCLDALTDGVELKVDLGRIGDRCFVNNASFGAYAQIVSDPAYRADKVRTTLDKLPELLLRQEGTGLQVTVDGAQVVSDPQAVLVSNNRYNTDDISGVGRRQRLDAGVLGVSAVHVGNARQAIGLLAARRSDGLVLTTGHEVVIASGSNHVAVGIDGESVQVPSPVKCSVRPGALRVRVPANRPGVASPRPRLNLHRLARIASGRGGGSH